MERPGGRDKASATSVRTHAVVSTGISCFFGKTNRASMSHVSRVDQGKEVEGIGKDGCHGFGVP